MAKKAAPAPAEAPTEPLPEATTNGHPGPQEEVELDGNRPVYTVRLKNIRGAVWSNATDRGTMLNAQVSRLYKRDGDDTWYSTYSYSAEDLLLVAEVSRLCSIEMFMMRQANTHVPF